MQSGLASLEAAHPQLDVPPCKDPANVIISTSLISGVRDTAYTVATATSALDFACSSKHSAQQSCIDWRSLDNIDANRKRVRGEVCVHDMEVSGY
jgi:hypothetical protein